jgi:hypothetical protein
MRKATEAASSCIALALLLTSGAVAAATEGTSNNFFGTTPAVNTGTDNSFFGGTAGQINTTGSSNAFFGTVSGNNNTTGEKNSFFGADSGTTNGSGFENTFFGYESGFNNETGYRNVAIGNRSGRVNQAGDSNVTIGYESGFLNTVSQNTFIGGYSGSNNSTGSLNAFLGAFAGTSNTTESSNTFLGAYSDGTAGISNATAVGYQAKVQQPNTLVLGSIAGVNSATVTARVGMGTGAPAKQLHIKGDSASAGAGNRTAIRVENTSATLAQRAMLELVNNGNSLITMTDTSLGQSWSFQNQGQYFLFQRNGNVPFKVSDTGQMTARNGANPVHFNLTPNGNLTITGVLTQGSDVNSKKDIVALDGQDVLARLDALPVSAWTYKSDEANARHAGPMAQDFHAAFGFGDDDTRLAPGDEAGVALAAVKELSAQVRGLQARVATLEAQLAEKDRAVASR